MASLLSVLSELPVLSVSSVFLVILTALLVYIGLEQLWISKATGTLPGPRFVWPFLGSLIEMIFAPFQFWKSQDDFGPVSWNKLLNMIFVFARDSNVSRQILNQSASNAQICLNLNGERLLGSNNIAFMMGNEHKALRVQLLPLFVRKALGTYISIQERCIREHISIWLSESKDQTVLEMRPRMRDLNMETSQNVFVGDYLPKEKIPKFRDDYNMVNAGMLCLPWSFPGSTLWRAIRARKRIVDLLTTLAAKSKAAMRDDQQPTCLLDYWMQGTVEAMTKAEKEGSPMPLHSSDFEVGSTVLDFLFASQDASTASLTWACHFLAQYPEVLAKVREEQQELRPNDDELTPEILGSMTYTKQVVKEVLRFRTPATLVPHKVTKPFDLEHEGKKIPVKEGMMIIPSLFSSSFQGFTDPHTFNPDRFSPERQEDVKFNTNWLVFGAGPHRCLGYEYAIYHLTAFVALFSTHVNLERVKTAEMDEIVYGPTIYPGDGCLLKISKREAVVM